MSLLQQPKARRRIVFMLTPLVDVMFLLLIFFMLSSQTAPYSLLEIMAAAGPPGSQQVASPPSSGPTAPVQQMMVSIARGYARINGERVEMVDLPGKLQGLKSAGFNSAMVLTNAAANVQDVVTVLEALHGVSLAEMQLVTQVSAGQ